MTEGGIPPEIRKDLRTRLWQAADDLTWMSLSDAARSLHYDNWAKDPTIGGKLERFLPRSEVRHYIKDGLLKIYCRERRGGELQLICRLAGVKEPIAPRQKFDRPHGCVLNDGRVVCWGAADKWKIIVMAMHERCFDAPNRTPFAVVFTRAAVHFSDPNTRRVVEDAARKLGIPGVTWRDD